MAQQQFGAFEFWILNLFRISIFEFRVSTVQIAALSPGALHTLDVKRKVFPTLDLQVRASVQCSVFGVQGRKKAANDPVCLLS